MALFHWRSRYMARYAPGRIIVAAETVELARVAARQAYDAYSKDTYDYLYAIGDDDSRVTLLDHLRRFERDIAAEPDLVPDGCVFVPGSE